LEQKNNNDVNIKFLDREADMNLIMNENILPLLEERVGVRFLNTFWLQKVFLFAALTIDRASI